MSNYTKLNLYPHNIKIYEKVDKKFITDSIVAIIQATGTGKSYIALQLALDHPEEKFLFLVPSLGVLEHIKSIIKKNGLEKELSNIEFTTYQSLINYSNDDIKNLEFDYLIIDEFHHIGSPVWGDRVKRIIDTHENAKILGMSAYTVRDRGTVYERDMVNPYTSEIFSNKVVSNYTLVDAIMDGVLKKPDYYSAYIDYSTSYVELQKRIKRFNPNSARYKDGYALLNRAKNQMHNAYQAKDIFQRHILPNGKYIYFCPVDGLSRNADVDTIMDEVTAWILDMGLTSKDFILYKSTSDMGELSKKQRDAFYYDYDEEHNSTKGKLRIMFAINQYNEGVHAPGVNGVIMGRGTHSDIVFYEQLGRAMNVAGERPMVLDLAGNVEFMKFLQDDLIACAKSYYASKNGVKHPNPIDMSKYRLNINVYNEDIRDTLEECSARLGMGFYDNLNLATNYFNHYHHLEIPAHFRTADGITYHPDGIQLGYWIRTIRKTYADGKLEYDKIEALNKIHMKWTNINSDEVWFLNYNLAVNYYNEHHNLEVPGKFKTSDGVTEDENGVNLGVWIRTQRLAYQGKQGYKITDEKIDLLKKIGMRFEPIDKLYHWKQKYEHAKRYYETHGDLEVPPSYKGDEGFNLWAWVKRQREQKDKLSEEQIDLLSQIGMRFELIDTEKETQLRIMEIDNYYFEHGDLEVPYQYETESGYHLGYYIKHLRDLYKAGKLDEKLVMHLQSMGMRFGNIDPLEVWFDKYKIAQAYYDQTGNLDVPKGFKIGDFNLYSWVKYQKERYLAGTISDHEIDLLSEIGLDLREWIKNKR